MRPVDEGDQDASFLSFREQLLDAVKKRDSKFILSIVAPDILNSLGGEGGIEEFKEQWRLDQPDSKFWDELGLILSLGGGFTESDGGRQFCAPYAAGQWAKVLKQLPKGSDLDDYTAIIREAVPLRSRPEQNSPALDTLSYDVVRFDSEPAQPEKQPAAGVQWVRVATLSGQRGYVLSSDIRSPSDYYACFEQVEGRWSMIVFAYGD